MKIFQKKINSHSKNNFNKHTNDESLYILIQNVITTSLKNVIIARRLLVKIAGSHLSTSPLPPKLLLIIHRSKIIFLSSHGEVSDEIFLYLDFYTENRSSFDQIMHAWKDFITSSITHCLAYSRVHKDFSPLDFWSPFVCLRKSKRHSFLIK